MSRSFYDALNQGRIDAHREEPPHPYELDPPCKCGHDDIYHHTYDEDLKPWPCGRCQCKRFREDR